MTRFLADELATSHHFNITAARTQLAYTPRISTDEGLNRLRDWLQYKDAPK
jgi:nucleoside-diphosphate-sugar epimerase